MKGSFLRWGVSNVETSLFVAQGPVFVKDRPDPCLSSLALFAESNGARGRARDAFRDSFGKS
jgi:hypothetical protein